MINEAQLNTLLSDLKQDHNLDFYFYSHESFIRRITRMLKLDDLKDFDNLRQHLKQTPGYVDHFVDRITVNVTDMFREAGFYKALREEVLTSLAHRPVIRVWHPGCSSGEECISLAMLLKESGLLAKAEIIGTDLSSKVIDRARAFTFSEHQLVHFQKNYELAGGQQSFQDYFHKKENNYVLKEELSDRIRYEVQNLSQQSRPDNCDLIVCRNVLIYFERDSLSRVFHAFNACTNSGAFISLGEKETLEFSPIEHHFEKTSNLRIWKKR